ncbi:MAG: hypothetical protein AAF787_01610 [Chloroflexota bacterium]
MTDNATLESTDGAVLEAEEVAEATAEPVAEVEAAPAEEPAFSYPKPNGAFLFVILLMIFYFVYWTISYFEIFVIRGA